jgi:hypothetical protein
MVAGAAGAAAGALEPHPADRPLSPAVSSSLASACGIVKADSEAAEKEISEKSAAQRDKVSKGAWGAYDENNAMIKHAWAQTGEGTHIDPAPYYDHEQNKVDVIQKAAASVHGNVTGTMSKAESDRRSRLGSLESEAQALAGMSASQGATKAEEVYKKLAAEAKGIDDARAKAYTDMASGYAAAARGGSPA